MPGLVAAHKLDVNTSEPRLSPRLAQPQRGSCSQDMGQHSPRGSPDYSLKHTSEQLGRLFFSKEKAVRSVHRAHPQRRCKGPALVPKEGACSGEGLWTRLCRALAAAAALHPQLPSPATFQLGQRQKDLYSIYIYISL